VVGIPTHLDGREHALTARCRRFANQLHGRYGLPVFTVDERLSSVAAEPSSPRPAARTGASARRCSTPPPPASSCKPSWTHDAMKDLEPKPCAGSSPSRSAPKSVGPATALVGIYTGGLWLAERLHAELGIAQEVGLIDVSFYRDDYGSKGLHASPKKTEIPFDVDGAHVILVDDVLYTGRTTRAALNELFDFGRPAGSSSPCWSTAADASCRSPRATAPTPSPRRSRASRTWSCSATTTGSSA